jgi:hypothetical protein
MYSEKHRKFLAGIGVNPLNVSVVQRRTDRPSSIFSTADRKPLEFTSSDKVPAGHVDVSDFLRVRDAGYTELIEMTKDSSPRQADLLEELILRVEDLRDDRRIAEQEYDEFNDLLNKTESVYVDTAYLGEGLMGPEYATYVGIKLKSVPPLGALRIVRHRRHR